MDRDRGYWVGALMRRLCLLLTILALGLDVWSQEWIPQVAFIGVRPAGPTLQSTADQLESSLRVRLINSREATIIDSIIVTEALVELGLSDVGGPAEARQIAAALDADFLISGAVRQVGEAVAVTLQMRTRTTGEISLGAEEMIEDDRYRPAVTALSRSIGSALTTARRIEIADIALLAELGETEEALRLLSIYEEGRRDDPQAAVLRDALQGRLAEQAFEESRRLTQLYLFDEALLRINTALFYEPENQLYKSEIARIEERRLEFETVQSAEILRQVELLVLSDHFDSAETLLSIAAQRDGDSDEIERLTKLITDGRWEQELYSQALEAFWRGEYNDARAKATQAILLAPEETKLRALLDQIDERAVRADSATDTWDGYVASLSSLDPVQLFGLRKPAAEGLRIRYGTAALSWRDRNTLDTAAIDVQHAAVGNDWARTLIPELGLPFVGLELSFGPFASVLWGWREDVGESLVVSAPLSIDVGGECSVRTSLFSLATDFGVAGRLGHFRWSERVRDLETGIETSEVTNSFAAAIAAVWRVQWSVNDTVSVGYEVVRDLLAFYSQLPHATWEHLGVRQSGVWIRRRW